MNDEYQLRSSNQFCVTEQCFVEDHPLVLRAHKDHTVVDVTKQPTPVEPLKRAPVTSIPPPIPPTPKKLGISIG